MVVDTLRPGPPAPQPPSAGAPPRAPLARRLDHQRHRWLAAAVVAALTLVSVALRTRQLHFYYWIDEAISVGISSHPLGQLPALLRQDGSPPLYYLLLHVWMQAFGSGEVATHVLSLVFASLTVPAAYWGGSSLFGRRAGVCSAVLAAGLPFLTSYAQETRMYALMALLSLVVAVSFVHVFVYRRRRYLPGFVLGLTLSLYTHNWALFLGLATFIAFLACVWSSPRERGGLWRDGAIGFGATALLFLPWVPTLLYQAQHTGAPWALPPVFWSLTQGLYFLTGGRGAAIAILLGAGAGLAAVRSAGPRERITLAAAISLAILGLGTLAIAWAYAKTTPAWSGRYLAVIVGPLTVLAGLGLARARGLGIAALILVSCLWVLDPRPTSLSAKSNVAPVARAMAPYVGPRTLVLSTQPEQVPTLAHYLPSVTRFGTPLGAVPDPRVVDWRNALTRFEHTSVAGVLAPMIRSLVGGQRVLLVLPTAFQKTPTWMSLIHRSSRQWLHYLEHDRQLVVIRRAAPHQYSGNVDVRAELFAVRRS